MDGDATKAIAVVGISFGFPAGATTSDTFWKLMMEKKNVSRDFPKERLAIDQIYHPDPTRRGQIPVRGGHFLTEDISEFDAPFFSITPDEAAVMDPQQRGLLEHTYWALENAGLSLEKLAGSKTSVYTGCFTNDWQHIQFKDTEQCGTTLALGAQPCVNANRVSWFFSFTGNSCNVDTACSSSLVCLDMGVTGLLARESDMSVIAGCNLIFSPDMMHSLCSMNMLSPTSMCHSFDHRANGYARGEGFGVLVLKRLSDALRDGHTIQAILRSTGCNQDGNTPGITMPSAVAQEDLIRSTYEKAGLSMYPTRYFEAHGTGTAVGDPIEADALGSAFRRTRTPEDPLIVGAVKSNIGHLEGAAGIAGVIKAILVLQKAIIPPNTNFQSLNPKIDAEYLRIKLPLEAMPWPVKGLRRASVNSFGFGGTNAHVVLDDVHHFLKAHFLVGNHNTVEDPPSTCPSRENEESSGPIRDENIAPRLLIFSSHDEKGSSRQASRYASFFHSMAVPEGGMGSYLDNLAHTLNFRRSKLPWRSFAIAESSSSLRSLETLMSHAHRSVDNPGLAMVFTGQGAQWAGMGRELVAYPMFAKRLLEAEEYIKHLGCIWNLREELFRSASDTCINRPDLSQPLCTALQVALVDLLGTFGIQPTAVVGHSSGEIAAAYAAGFISAESAWKISYFRGVCAAGRAGSKTGPQGGMIAVGLSQSAAIPYIEQVAKRFGGRGLTVACINSPKNVTISGDVEQIDILKTMLSHESIFARKLLVDVAYHSPHMEEVAGRYRALLVGCHQDASAERKSIMISSVTGEKITSAEEVDADYWVANMVSPVRFVDAVDHLFSNSTRRIWKKLDLSHMDHFYIDSILEVGPHAALQGPIRDILGRQSVAKNVPYSSVLVRKNSARQSLLEATGQLACLGYPVDLVRINYPSGKAPCSLMTLTELPGYPFDHSKKYWYERRLGKSYRTHSQNKWDLLGKPVPDWNPLEAKWRNVLRVAEMPWIEDHVINGSLVYPGAGMIVMAIEAARQLADHSRTIIGFEVKDCVFQRALAVPQDNDGAEVQFSLRASQDTVDSMNAWSSFRLCTYEGQEWHDCCNGYVRVEYEGKSSDVNSNAGATELLQAAKVTDDVMAELCSTNLNPKRLYQSLKESGFGFGPSFQRVVSGTIGPDGRSQADIELFDWPESQFPQPHVVHPTSLDGILHLSIAGVAEGGAKTVPTMIPSLVRKLWVSSQGLYSPSNSSIKASTWMTSQDNRGWEFDCSVLSSNKDKVLATFEGLRLTIVSDNAFDVDDAKVTRQVCYDVEYRPEPYFGPLQLKAETEGLSSLLNHVDRIGHKSPKLFILAMGLDGDTSILLGHQILKILAHPGASQEHGLGLPRYSKFVYLAPSEDSVAKAKELIGPFPGVSYRVVDNDRSLLDQGLEAGTFDVVISSSAGGAAFETLGSLISPSGWLISHDSELSPLLKGHEVSSKASFPTSRTVVSDTSVLLPGMDSQLFITVSHFRLPDIDTGRIKNVAFVIDTSSTEQQALVDALQIYTREVAAKLQYRIFSLEQAAAAAKEQGLAFVVLVELETRFLYNLSKDEYHILQKFLVSAEDILWVNPGGGENDSPPEYAIANGISRVVRNEYDDHRFTILQLDAEDVVSKEQLRAIATVLLRNHLADDPTSEPEYVEKNGALQIARVVENFGVGNEILLRSLTRQSRQLAVKDAPPLALTVGTPGLLDTLHFVEDKKAAQPLGQEEIEIQTHAVGMNFKDCLIALGQVPGTTLGIECSGVILRAGDNSDLQPGDRVLMIAPISTRARCHSSAACKIPDNMTFEEAAAIPAQFGTAWEVVRELARLQNGETILIHAAAGGTGQAALQIALYLGAIPLATVGSKAKKKLLMDEYNIPEDHIFYSRDTSFARGVMRVTRGRGVDVVINSLSGEGLVASWQCLAAYGRFVEIGKRDIMANSNLPMFPFRKNASFISFDATIWHKEKPAEARRDLKTLVSLFATKTFHTARPLHIYDIAEVETVFRHMQDGNIPGKMVMKVTPESRVSTILETKPSFSLDPDATYVIAGGLGGLGRSAARWMVSSNARNLVLLSRSGPRTKVAQEFLAELRSQGVRAEAPVCDVTDLKAMKKSFLEDLADMPPVKGCIQGSMVRRDDLLENMSFEAYNVGAACKTIGSWNLHTVLGKGLDFFVFLSSASGLVGLRGQTNYNAGNTFEDALARLRVSQGEKGISLDLGAMIDDGLLAETPDLLKRVLVYGALNPVTRQQFFAILDYYCNPSRPVASPKDGQVIIGLGTGGGTGLDAVDLSRQPIFRHMAAGESSGANSGALTDDINYAKQVSESQTLMEAGNIIAEALVDRLSRSLSAMEDIEVDIHRPLHTYGVDSLLAIELRRWITKEFKAEVAVFEIVGGSTFLALAMLVAGRSGIKHPAWHM
ncbi:reducing type I polyketide synthase [Thozetella sp. PMI_491]|nr:reducing type I polyketide synthase [Thozetella sp. PMI_491]